MISKHKLCAIWKIHTQSFGNENIAHGFADIDHLQYANHPKNMCNPIFHSLYIFWRALWPVYPTAASAIWLEKLIFFLKNSYDWQLDQKQEVACKLACRGPCCTDNDLTGGFSDDHPRESSTSAVELMLTVVALPKLKVGGMHFKVLHYLTVTFLIASISNFAPIY
jgi:hypothetical protein